MLPVLPQTTHALTLFTAAVAGPALVVAGARYPGSWTAKVVLVAAGAALVAVNTRTLLAQVQPKEQ